MKIGHALLLIALASSLPPAYAQSERWPAKPVRIVVTFPPAGLTDVVARVLASGLSKEFDQSFIVDNIPGAGGTIGIGSVVNSNPDGYTTIVVPSTFAIVPAIYKKLPYDPIKGIAPITMIGEGTHILVVHSAVKANNLKELIELARAKPGALNFGSAGVGTDLHLSLELFQQLTKTDMVHVPYKGIVPALNELLSGAIQLMLITELQSMHIKSGKLRAIAVTRRSPARPDLPAISELVPGYSFNSWWGMGTTAGTPREIISRLNQVIAQIMKQPEVLERLRNGGLEPAHSTPEELARVIARDFATWSKVVTTGNIKVE